MSQDEVTGKIVRILISCRAGNDDVKQPVIKSGAEDSATPASIGKPLVLSSSYILISPCSRVYIFAYASNAGVPSLS